MIIKFVFHSASDTHRSIFASFCNKVMAIVVLILLHAGLFKSYPCMCKLSYCSVSGDYSITVF